MKRVFITGVAGFIGYHLAARLIANGYSVCGIDNVNDYYDRALKRARLDQLRTHSEFEFHEFDLRNKQALLDLLGADVEVVVNLAAQAGVRYSILHPEKYIESNLVGFANVLEACRQNGVGNLIFASSSSVYGANTKMPFSERDNVDHPVSLYAATKKANELMAHSYSHLYGLPCTGLRFFTVYGPWGRPDMAYFKFAKAITEGQPIQIYNHGKMKRDFTYIDDVVNGIVALIDRPPAGSEAWSGDQPDPATSRAPYRIYNIGNNNPEELEHLISCLENELGKKAVREYLPMQAGDVPATYADISDLARDTGFFPSTKLEDGIKSFVRWYKSYYQV